jgi:hypothetical protein
MAYILIEYGESGSYQSVVLPVNPEELIFQRQSGSQTTSVINVGEVPLPGKSNLMLFTVDTFIPKNPNSPFNSTSSDKLHAGDTEFWKGLFNRFLESNERIVVSLIGIRNPGVLDSRVPATVVKFDYGWQGSDGDMRVVIDFREHRTITISTTKFEPSPTPLKQEIIIGSVVVCYGDPYKKPSKSGKKKKENKTIRKVTSIKKEAKCPYLIKTLSNKTIGWMQEADVTLKDVITASELITMRADS